VPRQFSKMLAHTNLGKLGGAWEQG